MLHALEQNPVLIDRRAAAGWSARLALRVEQREGRAVLAHNEHEGPLQVQKALYPEGPEVCHVAVLHPPGGIAAGDRLVVDTTVATGAHALLTTPGATKWYRSEGGRAEQQLRFQVEADGVLEWLPRETILFDGARPTSTLDVRLGAGAKFLGWEILCFGRAAAGERWRQGRAQLRTRIACPDRLIWNESGNLRADGGFQQSPVGLAGHSVSATFLAAGLDPAPALLAACRGAWPAAGDLRADPDEGARGITALPRLFVARYLGDSSEQAFHWFRDLWSLVRPALLGRPARAPRLWAT
jgi:urease accessory protein